MEKENTTLVARFFLWFTTNLLTVGSIKVSTTYSTVGSKQGWEFTHRFSERIACFLRMSQWAICSKKRAIRSFAHFLWVTWVIRSDRSLKKREWANRSGFFLNVQKNMILVKFVLNESLIYHERPEQIAHSCSFVMKNLSNSLTVALLTWETWVNSQPWL